MAIKKQSLIDLLVKTGAAADAKAAGELIDATDESDVSIPAGTRIYTKEVWEGDGTDKNPGIEKTLQKDGIKIGKELQIKDLKEKAGLEFDGKSPDKFLEAYKEHVSKEAGATVDEKVKSRDKTILELKEALGKEKTEKEAVIKKQAEVAKDFEILKHLPKDRDERFSDQQYLTLLKGELEFTEEEGAPVVKKGGAVVKNDKFEPLGYGDAINQVFQTSKWIKESAGGDGGAGAAGRGGKGGAPAGNLKFGTLKEFNEHLTKNNIHAGSEQAANMLRAAMKENPAMDLSVIA